MAEPVVITDLARPGFAPEVEEIRAFMAVMAADTPLDAEVIHQKAREETGLDDFGSDDYRERFDLFLKALSEIDGLHGPGRLSFHMQLLQVLKNRLRMERLLKDHPEIREIELVAGGEGPPELRLTATAARRAAEAGVGRWLVSVSHDGGMAAAVAVALTS